MKKLLAALLSTLSLLSLAACGAQEGAVEGTWYSVTDSTMFQLEGGKVTCSGQTVGQYEDNGDSIVLSLLDGKNLQLYLTTSGKIEVLADVAEGDGNIYFCRGLENVETITAAAEEAAAAAEEAHQQELIAEYQTWWEENAAGTWATDDERAYLVKMEFSDRQVKLEYADETSETLYWLNSEFYLKGEYPQVWIGMSADDPSAAEEDADYICIDFYGSSMTETGFLIQDCFYHKQ